jgi:hypothetical protein
LRQLQGYLTDLAPALEIDPFAVIADRVRVLVAQLAEHVGGLASFGGSAPALAGIRGEQARQYIYEAEDVQVIIEVQQDPSQADHKEILGLILGLDSSQPVEAQLWQADQRLATVVVDPVSNFLFSGLLPGVYELILSSSLIEIHIENIQL